MVEVAELNQRALRVIQTRLSNIFGEVSADETTQLLALEFSEVDEPLNLVGSVAAAGAVAVILLAQEMNVAADAVIAQLRKLMTP